MSARRAAYRGKAFKREPNPVNPPPSFRAMWRRQARVKIKRQPAESVITKIGLLTSIYDWY